MSSRPFFSLLLPTKNRSHIVGYAIQSALSQTFADFEIILADNDDTDGTRKVAGTFSDGRLRYLRTGGLNMTDNWETACKASQGKYVTVVEDKAALKPDALQRLHQAIERNKFPPVLTWRTDQFNDSVTPFTVLRAHETNEETTWAPKDIVQTFLSRPRRDYKWLIPRSLNSCCRQDLIHKIRGGPAGRFYSPLAPDYATGFLQLAYADRVLHLGCALALIGLKNSTGRAVLFKKEQGVKFLIESGVRPEEFIERMPVRAMLISNYVYGDYLRVRKLLGGWLDDHPLDLVNYFCECFHDIQQVQGLGVDAADEERAWEQALRRQPWEVQKSVLARVLPAKVQKDFFLSYRPPIGVVERMKELLRGPRRSRIRIFDFISPPSPPSQRELPVYPDILTAAAATDDAPARKQAG
jgi:glycosyltransferase involved in cell wall biosynthesis